MEINWLAYDLITMLVTILFVGMYVAIRMWREPME